MKHKHYDCIIAWANGAKMEYRSSSDGPWLAAKIPIWVDDYEFRIAEPKKSTETRWLWASKGGAISECLWAASPFDNGIKLEWSATEFEVEE